MTFRTRRLDRVLQGITLGTLSALLLTSGIRAQTPAEPPMPSIPELTAKQEKNAETFRQFKEGLFRLAKRLEKSDRTEDKDTAKIILAAIEQATKSGVDSQFQKLVLGLKAGNLTGNDLQKLEGDGQQLGKMLKEIYDILMTDDEDAKLKAEIARLEAILKDVKKIKADQERNQDNTQSKIGKTEDLAKEQAKIEERTKEVAGKMGGKDPKAGKEGQPAPKKDDKAENKADPKPGESNAEPKPDTGEEKGAPKDSDPDSKDPVKGGDGAEPKDMGKGGDPKEGAGEPKPGEPKEGEPKAGEPKAGEPKGGEPKDPKAGEPKPGEPKAGEPKEAKPSEGKGKGEGKGEPKPSEPGKGGEAKGDGKPPMGDPKPSESKGGGQPKPGEPGEPGAGGGPPPPPAKETPGRKEVQDALPFQDNAKKELEKKDRTNAGKNQDKATDELAKAIAELEKRLKQLREEEMKKLLANVEARVGKMLQMQIDVYNATVAIDAAVTKNNGVKTTADTQKAQQQGDKEQEIVFEADRALKLLETEGSAVAFARVLEEVRQDMIAVERRLKTAVVNSETQEIEKSIIDMLTEMKEALKKAQKDQDPKESKPGEPQDQKGNKKLIDLLAELKLIRSMQMQVNKRTEMHGKKTDQVTDPLIQGEVRQLSARQAKLQDMLEKIASGANQ